MKRVEKHEQRLRYLKALYDLAQGSPLQTVNHKEIERRAGLSSQCADDAFLYLKSEGLLQTQRPMGEINITHQGVKYHEAVISSAAEYRGRYLMDSFSEINASDDGLATLSETPAKYSPRIQTREQVADHMADSSGLDATLGHLPAGRVSTEQDLQAAKYLKQLIKAAMRKIKGSLANSLFETGVRFFLSKLKKTISW